MLLEIDDVVVDRALFEAAKAGDKDAAARLRDEVNGLQLYMHNLYVPTGQIPGEDGWGIVKEIFADGDAEKYTKVTLRDLESMGLVDSVIIEQFKTP